MESSTQSSVPDNQKHLMSSSVTFPVVGIGASAGGLQALLKFFENMPSESGMAFVVVLHLSPKHTSSADRILQAVTKMPVKQVTEPVLIERNHVYVIPPAKDLGMNDGYLRLTEPQRTRGDQVAIDLFFRALADVHKTKAIGIVLSGAGSDGSVGLARLKEQGGITLAQSPQDAEYDSMPSNAISTGTVDIVMPVIDMPQKLLELGTNLTHIQIPVSDSRYESAFEIEPEIKQRPNQLALRDILTLLRTRTGHNFKQYKAATVLRRIERRMQVNAIPDMASYATFLHDHLEETPALLKDMLIGVTNFFRDRESFEVLERDIIPEIFEQFAASEGENKEIRVWSAACSTGEEPYSLAMLLTEQAELKNSQAKIQVFATDIDEQALVIGRAGLYPSAIVTDVIPARIRQHFSKEQSHYRVKKELRERILFAAHNLLSDPPFSRLDLITCRNLLIYLDRDVQSEILQTFHFALKPGGYLFLGSSESADMCSNLFAPVDKKNRVYRAKSTSSTLRTRPAVHLSSGSPSLRLPQLPPTQQQQQQQQMIGRGKKISFAEVHQRVLEQYAPPSVIVDHESNIVHMSDRAGRFLRYVGGEPSHNLPTLVQPELRLELRTALFQALQTNKSVEARRVRVTRDDRTYYINMVVRPFRDNEANSDFMLVIFDEVEDVMSMESSTPHTEAKDSVLTQLEAELHRTKEQLQLTIEHSETSTEELKASNEELQAINEELRSATEELETSKEELQSINEELITVNAELKSKIEETGKINDDLQNLITSTDIATVFVDRGMRIKWFTPRATNLFNIIANDAGRSLLDITHRLDYDELAEDASRVFESLHLIEREVRAPTGQWYLARLLPYRTTDDRIEGAVLTFIDITERRHAEEQARASEAHMKLVAQSVTDYAIVTMDEDGLITTWNQGAKLMFGYTEAEVLGQCIDLIFTPEERAKGEHQAELKGAREYGSSIDQRWHQRKDGSRLYCSGVVYPMRDTELRGYAKIARDTTADYQRACEQEDQLVRSEASSQLKDEFFAVMSHELKHPLNLIQLNVELIARAPSVRASSATLRAAETIQRSVRSQAQIIDDLLDFSRVRTGKLKLNCTPVDIVSLLQEITNVLRPTAVAESIRLEGPNVPEQPLLIEADRTRMEQIAWNILNNAVKFTPEGGIVTIRLSDEGDMIRLDVTDTGQGIEPDFLPKVFDMFGQAEMQNTARAKHGLGIGLALVKQLVEAHRGRIEARSEGVGRGSQFSVWMPKCSKAEASCEDAESVVQQGQLHGLKILLIDDSEDITETMQMLLESEDAEVTTATGSEQGLALATETKFDLILSDIGMPGMDGCQMMGLIRQKGPNQQTPAIALTGYGSRTDIENAKRAGFNEHMSKPISFDTLIQTSLAISKQ
jgi:two-component system CheB/CheR fusion protein